ncbi:pheromone-regulated membrane protein, partial [Aulographum hederae CBS 113979]
GGILSNLLKLYHNQDADTSSLPYHSRGQSGSSFFSLTPTPLQTPGHSPPDSGTTTPRRGMFGRKSKNQSTASLLALAGGSSLTLGAANTPGREFSEEVAEKLKKLKRPDMGKRTRSAQGIKNAFHKMNKTKPDTRKIQNDLANIMTRHRFLTKLCRALMTYGAPTHRLEEYMNICSRVLGVEAQFLYIPGCMICSFDDSTLGTAEIRLVRTDQGVDLGKLRDTHELYKEVIHGSLGLEEAVVTLDKITKRDQKFNKWLLVFMYGVASVCVGPFAFQARLIDLPIAFFLGCIVGFLNLIVAPRAQVYSNVFEIAAAVITSCLARAFGSINGGTVFCFSALAQSSIALILPGYMVLCASLELQSRSIVAGSVRMVYAIIYSLFLGFGITIGTAIYGAIDNNATSATQCTNPMPKYWFFFFVPLFTLCLIVINQAKFRQWPVMMIISFAGYLVNYFSSTYFNGNTQISNTLGAFTIGVMANLYSRLGRSFDNAMIDLWEFSLRPFVRKYQKRAKARRERVAGGLRKLTSLHTPVKRRLGYGLAAAAMLPAIFVQVPSGLAVSGSLISGLQSANQIVRNETGTVTVVSAADPTASPLNSTAFNVGYSVIQVAIGITVGLFLSALIVYPKGKKGGGLFSF